MLHLVPADDPILRKRCRDDFVLTARAIDRMFSLMREKNALGLAAPQVGWDARFFITGWDEVFVNPRIVEVHEDCLPLPRIAAGVTRANRERRSRRVGEAAALKQCPRNPSELTKAERP